MEQPAIDAREQKILKARYENSMLAKYFLYAIFLCVFMVLGVTISLGASNYFARIEYVGERDISVDLSGFMNWKTILLYVLVILPLCFGAIYKAHKFQKKLSGMVHKNHRRLAIMDVLFTTLNSLVFCYSVVGGIGLIGFSESMARM